MTKITDSNTGEEKMTMEEFKAKQAEKMKELEGKQYHIEITLHYTDADVLSARAYLTKSELEQMMQTINQSVGNDMVGQVSLPAIDGKLITMLSLENLRGAEFKILSEVVTFEEIAING